MANFCEIDLTTNVVKRVCIVDNNIETSNGPLGENNKHADGIAWCNNFGELIIVTGYKLLLVDLLEEDMQNQEMFIFLMKIDL